MKIKPEERPTVIALGAMTAVVLTYVVVSGVMRMQSDNKPTTGVTNASLTNRSADSGGASGGTLNTANNGGNATYNPNSATMLASGNGVVKPKVDMYADGPPESLASRDPFRPVTPPVAPDALRSAPNLSARPRSLPRVEAAPISTGAPQPAAVPGFSAPPPIGMTPGVAPVPVPDVVLAGVITGPSSVAVLHVGDRAYELMPGEKMPLDLALVSITEDGVYVKQGKKTWFIEIGKSLSAAMAVQPGGFRTGGQAPSNQPPPARQVAETGPRNVPTRDPEEEKPVTVSNDTDQ